MRDARRRLRRFVRRFSRFFLVGLVSTALDFGVLNIMLILYPTREPWLIAIYNLVALLLANTNSYFMNTAWTFKERAEHDLRQRVLFVVQAIVNIGVGYALFWFAVRVLLLYTNVPAFVGGNLAKILSAAVASTLSYFMLRHVVFSRKRRLGGRL